MRRAGFLVLALLLTACGPKKSDFCDLQLGVDLGKPGMLVIGDSISIGYTPYVHAGLPQYDVVHTQCNSQSSTNGVEHIDNWLGQRPHWDVITINHGYWDMPGNAQHVAPDVYAENLTMEVTKALAHADRVFFVTSTSVIPAWTAFDNSVVQDYNAVAVAVMNQLGVPVIDLYTPSLSIPERDASVIHFQQSGYQTLASTIIGAIQ